MGSAHVVAWDSAHVEAWGSAHVVAWGSAHVVAWDSAHVEAWGFVSVLQQSAGVSCVAGTRATLITPDYPESPAEWAAMKSIPVVANELRLWKAVNPNGRDFYTDTVDYLAGDLVVAPDWDPDYSRECGHGLHLADSPEAARSFVADRYRDTCRLLEVVVNVEDCRCYPGRPEYPQKLRARACRVIREVPRDYTSFQAREDAKQ